MVKVQSTPTDTLRVKVASLNWETVHLTEWSIV